MQCEVFAASAKSQSLRFFPTRDGCGIGVCEFIFEPVNFAAELVVLRRFAGQFSLRKAVAS